LLVEAARKRQCLAHTGLPKVLSVDVARFGADRTVIGWRQGRKAVILAKLRGLDAEQVALRVIQAQESEAPDATVIDEDGVGGPVLDIMRYRGFKKGLYGFRGGQEAQRPDLYYNRRAECWGLMKEWLEQDVDIPDDPELGADLVGPEYMLAEGKRNAGSIVLESKEDMRKRGLGSPDCADMLAMTFAPKVAPPKREVRERQYVTRWPGSAVSSGSWMA
jgi:hypothetical protein